MSYPYYTIGLSANTPSARAEEIPTVDRTPGDDPEGYIPHPDLSHAVNAALILGMPLLVTGDPGTGKTQLAYSVAHALKCSVHKFETKSTSVARDLFYTFDAINAFKKKEQNDLREFIQYQALGCAILDAFPRANKSVDALLGGSHNQSMYTHRGPRRSVVLIDEIDKAPRDFPNDLLNEIERLYFRVPELQNLGSPGADHQSFERGSDEKIEPKFRPIVIITSNSEKGLPDPFLRRCVYFDIPFPEPKDMQKIVIERLKIINQKSVLLGNSDLLNEALEFFYSLRDEKQSTCLSRRPSTSEFLNWLQILDERQIERDNSLKEQWQLIETTISALAKNAEDRARVVDFMKTSWADS